MRPHHSTKLWDSKRHSSQPTSGHHLACSAWSSGDLLRLQDRGGSKNRATKIRTSWRPWTLDGGLARVVGFSRIRVSSVPICFSQDILSYTVITSNCSNPTSTACLLCAMWGLAPSRPHLRPGLTKLLASGTSLDAGVGGMRRN